MDRFLYDWQTLKSANREIKASQDQTAVAQKQIETTIRLDRRRAAREGYAFSAMLEAAMGRVIIEVADTRNFITPYTNMLGVSPAAVRARKNFKKGAFSELRGACVRYGGLLTTRLLELESEIVDFATKEDFDGQLSKIEAKANELRDEAVTDMERANAVLAETEPVSEPEPHLSFGWTTQQQTKTFARWAGVVLSILSVAFAIVSYTTHWDWWLQDDQVEKVAERFDRSYSDIGHTVQQGDPEWDPLVRVIKQYSPHSGELPKDRQPTTLGRFQAIAAAQTPAGEWTAPTTPIVLFYRKWPDPGSGAFKPGQDAFIIGTIGNLHDWVRRDRADFDFFWRTIFFGLLSACVGVTLALADTPRPAAR